MEQTAVKWLVRELMKSKDYQRVINDVNHSGTEEKDIIKQAIAMEKDQIIKAAIVSHFEGVRQSAKTSKEYIEYGEQYYNETYEK